MKTVTVLKILALNDVGIDAKEALNTPAVVEAGTCVPNVVNRMPRRRISPDISRLTEAWTVSLPNVANTAVRLMCPCRPWRCMFWRTSFFTSATCAGKPSAVRGCYRDTWGRTRVSGLSYVLNATRHSRIARISGRTCRRTPRSSSSSATAAIERSLWNHTSINTPSPPALARSLQAKPSNRQPTRFFVLEAEVKKKSLSKTQLR